MSAEDPIMLGYPAAATDDAEEELSKSALEDNLNRKGKNAYYYAHSHKATGPKVGGYGYLLSHWSLLLCLPSN